MQCMLKGARFWLEVGTRFGLREVLQTKARKNAKPSLFSIFYVWKDRKKADNKRRGESAAIYYAFHLE